MLSSNFNQLGTFGPEHAVSHPRGGTFWVRPAREEEIPELHELIASEISPGVGPVESMKRVYAINPIAFWRIEHKEPVQNRTIPIGMFGFMPLTHAGVVALRSGTLDRREPQLEYIVPAGEKPAALYVWAVVAKTVGRLSYPLIKRALGPDYLDVPCYAIPVTRGGTKAVADRGFQSVQNGEMKEGELVLLPIVEFPETKKEPTLDVKVASTAEHLQMSAFIRGAVFGSEQQCPYSEEFDGNDYCAMHLIGFVDNEPAASLRIRFFASFAKLERLAVLERYRKTAIKNDVMDKAISICRQKGYAKLYGQSQERLVGFYARFGFRPMQKNRDLVFSDHNYVEIEQDITPDPDCITINSDPYQIIRPEGLWNSPGVLEQSARRGASNPHA